ncbi:MAG TPA: hypothetical protein VFI19_11770 [Nocardioides sp.]|nr:hypothetical protein [Nocardioides sp.]
MWSPGPIGPVWSGGAGLSLASAMAVAVAVSVGGLADGVFVAGWVGADVGAFVGGALLWVGGTYGALVDPTLVGCDEGDDWWWLDAGWWPLGCEPPSLCSVVGLWVGLCVGLWVGFLVGWAGGGAELGGGGGGGGATVGCTGVGVLWVGAAATWDRSAVPPVPAALCGHQAIRHAATPSNAATAKRTAFVQVLRTSSSLTP